MTNMEISIRLRRKTGVNLHSLKLSAGSQVVNDKVLYKVSAGFFHLLRTSHNV